jgi:hypothetical protein
MQLKQRIKKLEKNKMFKPDCFCGKTLIDLWYGKPGASALTYCANCKDKFDFWAGLAREAEAALSENLTDFIKE